MRSITSLRRLIAAAFTKTQVSGPVSDPANSSPEEQTKAKERASVLSELLATPDYFPTEIDRTQNLLVFVRMSRESFRRSSFLDKRAVRAGSGAFSVALAELLPERSTIAAERPVHFILHGALCGSTLLSRYFEELPHCFVLKEPKLLTQLSRMKNSASDPAAVGPHAWADWFKVTIALLARGYASDAAVVIKPNDVCNWMGSLLLDHDRRTKIVFLCSPLKVFLLSVLKAEDRRKWVRGRLYQLRGHLAQVPFGAGILDGKLGDGQCAAAVWLLNSFVCASLVARSDSERILPMNSEELIGNTQESVRAAADFLGLTRDESNRAALTAMRSISFNAKNLQEPYDAATRASERDDAEARYGPEAVAAISWADRVSSGWLSRSPFPIE